MINWPLNSIFSQTWKTKYFFPEHSSWAKSLKSEMKEQLAVRQAFHRKVSKVGARERVEQMDVKSQKKMNKHSGETEGRVR